MIKTTAILMEEQKEYRYPANKISRMVSEGTIFPVVRGGFIQLIKTFLVSFWLPVFTGLRIYHLILRFRTGGAYSRSCIRLQFCNF